MRESPLQHVMRSRLDVEECGYGDAAATLTVTLPGGHMLRFRQLADGREVGAWAMAAGDEIGFSLGDIAKGLGSAVKAVGKVAKGIAVSGVFKAATTGLAAVAPALGPLAPAALAASGAMAATRHLLAAKGALKRGDKKRARQLVAEAKAIADRTPKGSGASSAQVMRAASQNAERVYALLLRPA